MIQINVFLIAVYYDYHPLSKAWLLAWLPITFNLLAFVMQSHLLQKGDITATISSKLFHSEIASEVLITIGMLLIFVVKSLQATDSTPSLHTHTVDNLYV